MTNKEFADFEQMAALNGHATVVVQMTSIEGISNSKIPVLVRTLERMLELGKEIQKSAK